MFWSWWRFLEKAERALQGRAVQGPMSYIKGSRLYSAEICVLKTPAPALCDGTEAGRKARGWLASR